VFEQTDEKLISKALKGNNRAWDKLVNRYEKAIYHYGLRMTGHADDAMDLMQEVFMSVCRNLHTYRGDGQFKSWLFRIAHFRCVEYYRRKRPSAEQDNDTELLDEQACASAATFAAAQRNELVKAMQGLPLEQKAVVELKFFSQFTFDEIAEQLDLSSNTVKSRLYSALDKLKASMEEQYV